jgi:alkaline phosphatase
MLRLQPIREAECVQYEIYRIIQNNSSNAYVTDSAPGSTAFATGVKTKNTFVGVDAAGKALAQIPDIIAAKGLVSGLISTGDVTDATPADFTLILTTGTVRNPF